MRVLVTGGAGFIGSNLVDALLARGDDVMVLDDLTTGFAEHVPAVAKLFVGDVADASAVREAIDGCELVFHLAAARSVSRSVEDPLTTDRVNTHGTLTVLAAAREAGVRRVVSSSSSSVYGGAAQLPTSEAAPVRPRSPYAVTKLAGEHYCRVFAELYGLETVSLRYFNVYGPRQRPDSMYAAVIPLFLDALRRGERPVVHGDGLQCRSFTYIDDVVRANLLAAEAPAQAVSGGVYNAAAERSVTLLELLGLLGQALGVTPDPVHTDPRAGDIRASQADGAAARRDLGFEAEVAFEDGIRRTVSWFSERQGGGA